MLDRQNSVKEEYMQMYVVVWKLEDVDWLYVWLRDRTKALLKDKFSG